MESYPKRDEAKNEVFVGGLPRSLNRSDVEELFKSCGEVHAVYLGTVEKGRPNYAFVAFKTPEGAAKALKLTWSPNPSGIHVSLRRSRAAGHPGSRGGADKDVRTRGKNAGGHDSNFLPPVMGTTPSPIPLAPLMPFPPVGQAPRVVPQRFGPRFPRMNPAGSLPQAMGARAGFPPQSNRMMGQLSGYTAPEDGVMGHLTQPPFNAAGMLDSNMASFGAPGSMFTPVLQSGTLYYQPVHTGCTQPGVYAYPPPAGFPAYPVQNYFTMIPAGGVDVVNGQVDGDIDETGRRRTSSFTFGDEVNLGKEVQAGELKAFDLPPDFNNSGPFDQEVIMKVGLYKRRGMNGKDVITGGRIAIVEAGDQRPLRSIEGRDFTVWREFEPKGRAYMVLRVEPDKETGKPSVIQTYNLPGYDGNTKGGGGIDGTDVYECVSGMLGHLGLEGKSADGEKVGGGQDGIGRIGGTDIEKREKGAVAPPADKIEGKDINEAGNNEIAPEAEAGIGPEENGEEEDQEVCVEKTVEAKQPNDA